MNFANFLFFLKSTSGAAFSFGSKVSDLQFHKCFIFYECFWGFWPHFSNLFFAELLIICNKAAIPLDAGRKLNVHKTFRRRPGRLLNVLCTFNLRPVSRGILKNKKLIKILEIEKLWKVAKLFIAELTLVNCITKCQNCFAHSGLV